MLTPLKSIRLHLEKSQLEVCRAAGISQPKLSLCERGLASLTPAEARKIAKVLKVRVYDILDPEQTRRRVKD
jgi:transcriptional regulator with XRE-family HTH domain